MELLLKCKHLFLNSLSNQAFDDRQDNPKLPLLAFRSADENLS